MRLDKDMPEIGVSVERLRKWLWS